MAVAGVPNPDADHAGSLAALAMAMHEAAARVSADWPAALSLRIGISSGPVVAGVIGQRKFAYDLWGDTVNTASRMESHGQPGRIQVCDTTYEQLRDRYEFTGPHVIDVKGKGTLTTYYLEGPRR
jgi:class 3 adenylate cyclase